MDCANLGVRRGFISLRNELFIPGERLEASPSRTEVGMMPEAKRWVGWNGEDLPRASVRGVRHSAVGRQFIYSICLVNDSYRRSEPAQRKYRSEATGRSHSDLPELMRGPRTK